MKPECSTGLAQVPVLHTGAHCGVTPPNLGRASTYTTINKLPKLKQLPSEENLGDLALFLSHADHD